MKLITAYILILLILSQTFSKWLTVAAFNLNRDYIAKNLCENRNRPAMKCGGHCVLMKRMKQEEEQEKNVPVKMEFPTIVLSSKTSFPPDNISGYAVCVSIISHYPRSIGRPIDRASAIFHPPGA